jgi:rod shape-determining protein MreC
VARSRRSRRTLTVVVLIVLSLSIISLDLTGRTHNITSGVKSVANSVFSPLRQAVSDVIDPIGDFFAGAVHYGALQSENQRLQATNGRLRQSQAQRAFEKNQLHQLQQLMRLKNLPSISALPTVIAQTQEKDSSNFTMTITIDKGRSDGVDVGMPVVGAGGLVGQVIQSFHHNAVVQLVNDGQSKVGVSFGPTQQYTATVDGQGPGSPMTADLVAPHTPLHKGEVMYTSGFDAAAYPPGIPVARVLSVHTSSGASQETIAVAPMANLNQLAYVDVVLWEPTA